MTRKHFPVFESETYSGTVMSCAIVAVYPSWTKIVGSVKESLMNKRYNVAITHPKSTTFIEPYIQVNM